MGDKADKERNAKERYCFGSENKPNGFVEDRAKPSEAVDYMTPDEAYKKRLSKTTHHISKTIGFR